MMQKKLSFLLAAGVKEILADKMLELPLRITPYQVAFFQSEKIEHRRIAE